MAESETPKADALHLSTGLDSVAAYREAINLARTLERELATLRASLAESQKCIDDVIQDRDRLQGELASVRLDAERYRFLRGPYSKRDEICSRDLSALELNAVIDAARSREPKEQA